MSITLPHDIIDHLDIPWPAWIWAIIVLAMVLLLGVMGFLLYRLWKRWRKKNPQPISSETPTHQRARTEEILEQMESMCQRDLSEWTSQAQFYSELGLLLRETLEILTSINATDLTLQELRRVHLLPLKDIGADEEKFFWEFLKRGEEVKFAHLSIEPFRCREDCERVHRLTKLMFLRRTVSP